MRQEFTRAAARLDRQRGSPDLRLVGFPNRDSDDFGENKCYFLLESVILQLCHLCRGIDTAIVFFGLMESEKMSNRSKNGSVDASNDTFEVRKCLATLYESAHFIKN